MKETSKTLSNSLGERKPLEEGRGVSSYSLFAFNSSARGIKLKMRLLRDCLPDNPILRSSAPHLNSWFLVVIYKISYHFCDVNNVMPPLMRESLVHRTSVATYKDIPYRAQMMPMPAIQYSF